MAKPRPMGQFLLLTCLCPAHEPKMVFILSRVLVYTHMYVLYVRVVCVCMDAYNLLMSSFNSPQLV